MKEKLINNTVTPIPYSHLCLGYKRLNKRRCYSKICHQNSANVCLCNYGLEMEIGKVSRSNYVFPGSF